MLDIISVVTFWSSKSGFELVANLQKDKNLELSSIVIISFNVGIDCLNSSKLNFVLLVVMSPFSSQWLEIAITSFWLRKKSIGTTMQPIEYIA